MVRKQKATVLDEIAVTSESSRFHNETLETLSKDVYLKKVSISVGLKDLLLDADVRLNHGTKYGLIGPNGCGKTTLMKCLGYKRVSGLADNLRILYVEQLPVESTSKLVLETVLAADKDRVKLMLLLSTLEAALSSADPLKIKQAIKQVKLEEQKANLAAAQKTATERTGARGHRARKALVEQESLVAELEALSLDEVVDSNTDEAFVAQEMALQLSEQLKGYDSEEVLRSKAAKTSRVSVIQIRRCSSQPECSQKAGEFVPHWLQRCFFSLTYFSLTSQQTISICPLYCGSKITCGILKT
uniref:ABC transporter domain-containing protein n=1 Tax=Candidozyma auris TaxID=498019 RepID=A0A0L0NY14_CANAR